MRADVQIERCVDPLFVFYDIQSPLLKKESLPLKRVSFHPSSIACKIDFNKDMTQSGGKHR